MPKDVIRVGHTYVSRFDKKFYVQDITGQKVTWCHVGDVSRVEGSLGRFAALMIAEVPNE